jgi:hypothetical protein
MEIKRLTVMMEFRRLRSFKKIVFQTVKFYFYHYE